MNSQLTEKNIEITMCGKLVPLFLGHTGHTDNDKIWALLVYIKDA